jgi:hypothetical protein
LKLLAKHNTSAAGATQRKNCQLLGQVLQMQLVAPLHQHCHLMHLQAVHWSHQQLAVGMQFLCFLCMAALAAACNRC